MAKPKIDNRCPNDALRFYIQASATDGYSSLLSWGDISPLYGNRVPLLSVNENNVGLTGGPRVLAPGDVRGGRYVTGTLILTVVRAAPQVSEKKGLLAMLRGIRCGGDRARARRPHTRAAPARRPGRVEQSRAGGGGRQAADRLRAQRRAGAGVGAVRRPDGSVGPVPRADRGGGRARRRQARSSSPSSARTTMPPRAARRACRARSTTWSGATRASLADERADLRAGALRRRLSRHRRRLPRRAREARIRPRARARREHRDGAARGSRRHGPAARPRRRAADRTLARAVEAGRLPARRRRAEAGRQPLCDSPATAR